MSYQDEHDDTLEADFRAAVDRETEVQGFPPELNQVRSVHEARELEREALTELGKAMARYCSIRAHRLALQLRGANEREHQTEGAPTDHP